MTSRDELFNTISVIEDMSGYNIFNILNSEESSWLDDRERILSSPKYYNTLLYMYMNNIDINQPGYSSIKFRNEIERYTRQYKPRVQHVDEQALYIRMGDVIVDTDRYDSDHTEVLKDIMTSKKLVIVCCMSFRGNCEYRSEWSYSARAVRINKVFFNNILDQIHTICPEIEIEVYSPPDPDHAVCYLTSRGFIGLKETTWFKHLNYKHDHNSISHNS